MPSFAHTLRYAVALVAILFTLAFGFGMLYQLYQFTLFHDTWFLSLAISYGLFTALSGGVGWLAHPS